MSSASRQLHFLVVDDNEGIRDVFSRLVERAGHVAATAEDGQAAVERLQLEGFDVMLLDLTMPRTMAWRLFVGSGSTLRSPRP